MLIHSTCRQAGVLWSSSQKHKMIINMRRIGCSEGINCRLGCLGPSLGCGGHLMFGAVEWPACMRKAFWQAAKYASNCKASLLERWIPNSLNKSQKRNHFLLILPAIPRGERVGETHTDSFGGFHSRENSGGDL